MDPFWTVVGEQIAELTRASSAADVLRILAHDRDPYRLTDPDHHTSGDAFFAGSGGDATVREALYDAGWALLWSEASYYYAMSAPDGSAITYCEGDIYARDLRAGRAVA